MTKLSDNQRVIVSAAAQHEAGLARPPKNLPAAARNAVFNSLIKNNLLTEINAPCEHAGLGWRQDDDGAWIVVRITDDGLRAIGIDPNEDAAAAPTAPLDAPVADDGAAAAEASHAAPTAPEKALHGEAPVRLITPPRTSLRTAASALLEAWDACPAEDTTDNAISRAVEALRAAMVARQPRPARIPGMPRQGTKQATVLTLLRRPEGATIMQIMEATGWQQHTVRGFFAGIKKRQGISVTVLERVRQVGPGAQGSRGSHSIYAVVA